MVKIHPAANKLSNSPQLLSDFFQDDGQPPTPRSNHTLTRPALLPSRTMPAQSIPPPMRQPPPAPAPPRPPVPPPVQSAPPAGGTTCDCGVPALVRTVQRETNNKGRQFYICGHESTCEFWQWVDDAPPRPVRSVAPASRSRTLPAAPFGNADEEDDKQCKCDPPARAAWRTVNKEGPNKGRNFYACRKPQGSQCDFFEWAEEGGGATGAGAASGLPCYKVYSSLPHAHLGRSRTH